MALKSMLAVYAGDAAGSVGLRFAAQLARTHDAHLTGAVWHGPSLLEARFRRFLTPEIRDVLANRDQDVVAEIRQGFEAQIASEGLAGRAEFIELHGQSDFSLAHTARGFDLTVMGNRTVQIGREHFAARPDVVALRSGRPIVIVPAALDAARPLDHVVLAWDGKRSAARALGDALHVLGGFHRVSVLRVGSEKDARPADAALSLLSRHGISADSVLRPPGRNGISATLRGHCAETGAGLLIMGAYEHSKFSEDLIGGVTNDILAFTDIPVLMSH
jgi:nucleotide-binding universal stress UspA family protein